MKKNKLFLPQLNGLRFFAFLMIFFVHAPVFYLITDSEKIFNINKIIVNNLQIYLNFGVDLFFCLSAFLITILLINEYEKNKTISIKNFLIRRLLRIAPIYYLYIFIAFIILPMIINETGVPRFGESAYAEFFNTKIFPNILFLSNFAGWSSHFMGHLWSISLEMQIYFTLPFLLFYFLEKDRKNKLRNFIKSLLVLLVFSNLVKLLYVLLNYSHPRIYFEFLTRLDPFIVGTLVAIKYKYYSHIKIPFQLILSIIFISINFLLPSPFSEKQNLYIPLIYISNALSFGLILDYLITKPGSYLSKFFSLKPIVYLGNLAYGLYIYHIVSLYFAKKIFEKLNLTIFGKYWFLLIMLAFLITFIFSFLSYYLYEKKFLKLKSKFS